MAHVTTAERNIAIHQAWKEAGGYQNQGILSKLAREHSLTRERIWSIVKKIESQKGEDEKVPSKVMFDATMPGFKVSVETHDEFFKLAEERSWSVAFMLRQAVTFYLESQITLKHKKSAPNKQ